MDVIAIDPSLVCTAMVVNDVKYIYTGTHIAFTEKGKYKSWFERFDDLIVIKTYDFSTTKSGAYAEAELKKFKVYYSIAKDIVADILKNRKHAEYKLCIEGYSYSSSAGPLIDLVTFGSILRLTLAINGMTEFTVIPPQELKTKAASLVYEREKGKNKPYRNKNGLAAGSFTKRDMMECLLVDSKLSSDSWVKRLKEHADDLMELKATPKPVEDMNDAKLMYEWIIRGE